MHGHDSVGATGLHVGAVPDRAVGRCLGKTGGNLYDLLGINVGQLGSPGRGGIFQGQVPPLDQPVGLLLLKGGLVNRSASLEQVLAVLEIAAELLVPEPLGQDNMGQSRCQCAVFGGLDRQPLVGLGSSIAHTWINGHHRAFIQQPVELGDGIGNLTVGRERIAGPDNQVLHLIQVIVTVAPEPLRVETAHLLHFGTDRAVGDVVGGADHLGQVIVQDSIVI